MGAWVKTLLVENLEKLLLMGVPTRSILATQNIDQVEGNQHLAFCSIILSGSVTEPFW